ncbi:hypothetical protein [Niveibacterium sp.]|uniref:hypothetical protein n=1 Tax=Niveibacterium sp. TaxID=2017444 RepID=UPI0035B0FD58
MKWPTRNERVRAMRHRLETQEWPRLQMSLLVALAGAAGFLGNWGLLRAGVGSMALRYPLAVLLAWGAFVALLWIWLKARDQDGGADAGDTGDALDLLPEGKGSHAASGGHGTPDAGDLLDGLAAADEFALPLVAIVFVVTLVLAALWIVTGAPTLFAELLVDSALSASLYHRMRHGDAQHWLETAWRSTRKPFIIAAVMLTILGFAVQTLHPGAHTLGQAFTAARVHGS